MRECLNVAKKQTNLGIRKNPELNNQDQRDDVKGKLETNEKTPDSIRRASKDMYE